MLRGICPLLIEKPGTNDRKTGKTSQSRTLFIPINEKYKNKLFFRGFAQGRGFYFYLRFYKAAIINIFL